jgi:arylsulfatase A-like enzyme
MIKTEEKLKSFPKEIMTLAIGSGLITGLVEGLLLLILYRSNLFVWRLEHRAIWYETLWISPLVDLVLFGLAGSALAFLSTLLPKINIRKFSRFLFILLAVFDWTFAILFGRISLIALLVLAVGLSVQLVNYVSRSEVYFTNLMRRLNPWLIGITAAIFVLVQGGGWLNEKIKTANLPEPQTDAPNVIVIVVDTLRADHLSSYGYQRDTSPFIDSLAKQGTQFQNAISAASWTQPSHASMLTGRYTYEHQAELKPLDNRFATIGETLQLNGYRTGAFSGNTEFFTRRQGFGRGFLHFEDNNQSLQDDFLNSSLYGFIFDFYGLRKLLHYEGSFTRKYAEDVNRSALAWVDKDTSKPFFVFMNYFDVHDPYMPPEPYRSKYAVAEHPGGLINGYVERYHPTLTPEQLQSEIDAYDGGISYVDDQIKNLFSELDKRGALENTIVIITSDHGESLGEHGLLQHSTSLYLQEIHVPLIIWQPGTIPAKLVDTPISTTSLPSTILSLVKSQKDPFPGPSLAQLIFTDQTPANWPDPISEVAQFDGAAEENPTTHGEMKSVFSAQMQYIVHEKFGNALYNWRIDPKEMNDMAGDPSMTSMLDAFKLYLQQLIGDPIFKQP